MNYRHAYHAGNFADVVKHIVLTVVIEHLKQKSAPFRVIDTHAGIGLYDLEADAAQRTREWAAGIGRLIGPEAEPLPPAVARAIEPYLAVVRTLNPPGLLQRYPGSPRLARALIRPQDSLVANELHPEDAALLRRLFVNDPQTRMLEIDGWTALKSLLPPKERRGVILIDPPFEEPRELDRLVIGLGEAMKRFATGIYLLWYPIKDPRRIAAFHRRLVEAGHGRLMSIEMRIRPAVDIERLNGCGLVVVNPPYRLDLTLQQVLKEIAPRLGDTGASKATVEWLMPADHRKREENTSKRSGIKNR